MEPPLAKLSADEEAERVEAEQDKLIGDFVASASAFWGVDKLFAPAAPRPIVPFADALACAGCHEEFTFYRYKYQCTGGCALAFCDNCSGNYICLPGAKVTDRCCKPCLHKNSPMDYTKSADIFDTGVSKRTVVLLPPEMGTRYNYIYTVEHLSKYYRVVTLDLPGTGALAAEKPTLTSMLRSIYQGINSHCPDKKAVLMGLSMGGYLAMRFADKYPQMVQGLVLVDCMAEQFGGSQISFAGGDVFTSFLGKKDRSNIMKKKFPNVSPDRLIRAYMTTTMNTEKAFDFAAVIAESEEGFYFNCLADFPGKVLFVSGETGWRSAEQKYLYAAQDTVKNSEKTAKVFIAPKVGHDVLLHQDSFDVVHKEIQDFLVTVFK